MDKKSKKTSNTSSSANSNASSSMDIKFSRRGRRNEHKIAQSRSRSFLHCLGKHFGRHFFHHHSHHTRAGIYSSQEDIRSSSTDSFAMTMERASRYDCHMATSNIDLTSAERQASSRSSSTSTYSRCSPGFCPFDTEESDEFQCFVAEIYRPGSAMEQRRELRALSSDEDGHDDGDDENENEPGAVGGRASSKKSGGSSTSSDRTSKSSGQQKKGGLHLSRLSITSSVSRLFHHFSISSSSTRSQSCSSSPMRSAEKKTKSKKSSTMKKSTTAAVSMAAATSAALWKPLKKEKKEKKQKSILRPPVPYVYTKGMSGLYSRVPRYPNCCPYSMQQCA